eukprot:CAMPEP_0117448680 /NCGR_PEP_ID=MMETSP0759-20121206/7532_1 /TAXON_ID=63605 /ORGANISM="Percolomonas cosmopolitus, Strain WS" /LENGTH=603 /DNA_ID=CAMNT_0005241087 /DNA_START=152 /DNA_END=1963 /DNA_ORIENTATION=-
MAKADLFYSVLEHAREKRLKRQILDEWVLKTKLRQEQHMQHELAQLFHQRTMRQHCFAAWKRAVSEVRIERQIEAKAVEHHERNLLQRTFDFWTQYVDGRHEYRLRAVFHTWQRYTSLTKRKHHFVRQREKFMCFRHFQHWKRSCSLRRMERELELYNRDRLLLSCLRHWKHVCQENQQMRGRLHIALAFHAHKLKARAFKSLQLNQCAQCVINRRHKRLITKYFAEWEHTAQIRRFWKELTSMATKHYELQLQQKMLSVWVQYTRASQEEQTKMAYALYHFQTRFRERMQQSCFSAWKQHCKLRKKRHFNKVKADIFLSYRFFMRWSRALKEHLELKEDMAQCHYSLVMLKHSFGAWKRYINHRRIQNRIKEHAERISENALKRRHFEIWMLSWRIREHEARIADNLHHSLLLRSAFHQFVRAYHNSQQKKNEMVHEFRMKWSQELLYRTFFTWRIYSNQHLRKEHDKKRADIFRRDKQLSRHFRRWNHLVVKKEMLSISELLSESSMLDTMEDVSFLSLGAASGGGGGGALQDISKFQGAPWSSVRRVGSSTTHHMSSQERMSTSASYSQRIGHMSGSISAYDQNGVQVSSIIALDDPFLV